MSAGPGLAEEAIALAQSRRRLASPLAGWHHMTDSTNILGHPQASGAEGGPARRVLVEAAAALQAKSTPAVTVRDALVASS